MAADSSLTDTGAAPLSEYEKVKAAEAPEKAVSLKGEAQASRAASEKLAEGRDTGSPAREDPSIV